MYVADHRKANDGLRSVTYSDCGYAHDKPPATSLNSCVTRRTATRPKVGHVQEEMQVAL